MSALIFALVLAVTEGEGPSAATLDTLRATYVAEERALLTSQEERGRVARNLVRLEARERELDRRSEELGRRRAEAAARLSEATARLAALELDLASHRRRAGLRLAAVARQGTARPLELLLTARDPEDFVYRYLALRELAKAEAGLIERLRAAAAEADALRVLLAAQAEAVAALERDAAADRLRAAALVELEREQLKTLADEADERKLWMEAVRDQARELGAMLSRMPAAKGPEARPGAGDPVTGAVVARFGEPDPDAGTFLPANGVRYAAAPGAPVRAAAAGEVVYADWFQGLGRLVILDHGGGVQSLYAHLGVLAVAAGGRVLAGEILGEAGDSGSIAEPGLYFEVRRGGKPVDPAGWLRQRERRESRVTRGAR